MPVVQQEKDQGLRLVELKSHDWRQFYFKLVQFISNFYCESLSRNVLIKFSSTH